MALLGHHTGVYMYQVSCMHELPNASDERLFVQKSDV